MVVISICNSKNYVQLNLTIKYKTSMNDVALFMISSENKFTLHHSKRRDRNKSSGDGFSPYLEHSYFISRLMDARKDNSAMEKKKTT